MIRTLADQHLAQNAGRRYPLADDSSFPDDSAILEMRLTVRGAAVGLAPSARITGISDVTSGTVAVRRISVEVSVSSSVRCTVPFDIPSGMADVPYVACVMSDEVDGEMTVSKSVLSLQTGKYDVAFARTVVTCQSLGVDSILGADRTYGYGEEYSDNPTAVSGDVVLEYGKNSEPYIDGQYLRLDVAKGAGYGERCQTASTGQHCGNILFTINGERPGSDGEIRITGHSGICVTPLADEHALLIAMDSSASSKVTETCDTNC